MESQSKKNIMNNKKDKNIDYIKPIIKWVGGKTQIIDNIIAEFPNKIDNYHECFLGGGSVLFALLQNVETEKIIVKKEIYAYDLNDTLINMYKNIQTKHKDILIEINKLIDDYNSIETEDYNSIKTEDYNSIKTEDITANRKPKSLDEAKTSKESYYYWIRSKFNELNQEDKNKPLGSAYFIFLNKTCFRGVYREGPNGFNVPFGHYKSPEIINGEHLEKVSNLIKNVNFICLDFEKSLKKIKKNDFVYLDPPYVPENATSFVGYTSDGFSLEKHKTLFEECKKYNFVMSNSDVDLVKNSFDDKKKFYIKIISCKRSINSKKPNAKTNEVIIKSKK